MLCAKRIATECIDAKAGRRDVRGARARVPALRAVVPQERRGIGHVQTERRQAREFAAANQFNGDISRVSTAAIPDGIAASGVVWVRGWMLTDFGAFDGAGLEVVST